MTDDVDAVVLADDRDLRAMTAAARRFGLAPRISDWERIATEHRMLLLRHAADGIEVDVALGALPFEIEAIRRATRVRFGSTSAPIIRAEDLVVMKALARRDRDIVDIETVLDAHPKLEVRAIRSQLASFSEALDDPSIVGDFDALIARRRRRR